MDYLNDRDVNAQLTLENENSQNVFSLLKVSSPPHGGDTCGEGK